MICPGDMLKFGRTVPLASLYYKPETRECVNISTHNATLFVVGEASYDHLHNELIPVLVNGLFGWVLSYYTVSIDS